jgi:hypothetical protein
MRAVLGALFLVGCGGPDQQFSDLYPVFSSAPDVVDFGDVGPPLSGTATFTISNAGLKTMDVTGVVDDEAGIFALVEPLDLSVAPDESVEVTLRFTPPTFRTYKANLLLETTDEEHATVRVPLVGRGVDLPFPDVAIAPAQTIELPEVAPSDTDYFVFEVVNEGDADLEITEMVLDGPAEFVITRLEPATVVPGDRTTGIVEYAPNGAEGATATVTVRTNDPDEPETTVLLIGNGGGDFEYPVAVIDCPTDVQLTGPENIRFSAAGSYDPAGFEPLTYQWFVTQRPAASDGSIPLDPDDTRDVDLRVDVAGTWQIMVLVTNTVGTASIPAVCTFEAIPEDDLHVELSWDGPAADIDLHLNLAGAAMFDVPSVCNWCNKNEDWGVSGTDDDPRLDIDDQGGFGPENINVLHPADGAYDIVVHDFLGNGDGITTATVKVWLEGSLVFDDSAAIEQGQIWRVGQVSWSATPTFAADGQVTGVGPRQICF